MTNRRKVFSVAILGMTVAALLVVPPAPMLQRAAYACQPTFHAVCDLSRAGKAVPTSAPQIAAVGRECASVAILSLPAEDGKAPSMESSTDAKQLGEKRAAQNAVAPPPTTPLSAEPKMGDTRMVDDQKQVFFLGFGWIEDSDTPNDAILADGDGDINKQVGTMG